MFTEPLTRLAARADTDPPPGDGDLDPTVITKSLTSIDISGPPSGPSDIIYLLREIKVRYCTTKIDILINIIKNAKLTYIECIKSKYGS